MDEFEKECYDKWCEFVHLDLNLKIAHLMGWTGITQNRNMPTNYSGERPDGTYGSMWLYTTNEECGTLILDHIAALGWAATVFTGGWHGKRLIRCCVMQTPNGPAVDVVAETRPLAICQAFVQAMERWGDG